MIGPMRVLTRRTHRMTDGFTHASYQAISAFVHDDPQHPGRDRAHLGGSARPVVEIHPLAKPTKCTWRRHAFHLGQILLFDPERWVRQALGQVPVVR